MADPVPATAAAWTFSSAMDDVCLCEHQRKYHAYPGSAGTPCATVGCCCDIFVQRDVEEADRG